MDVVGCFPPPPFNRLPPDGHEFPQKFREEMPAAIPIIDATKTAPPLPSSEPPRRTLVQVLPSKSKVAANWRQDERSGKSVRDKIAMFQSVPDGPVSPGGYSKLCKYKSSDDVFFDEDERSMAKPFSRSVVSVDRLGGRKSSFSSNGDSGSELGVRTQSSMDLTSCSSSAYSSSCSPDSSLSSTTSSYLGYSSTLPRKACTTETIKTERNPKIVTRTSSFNVHSRSQSMLDINPSPFGKPREEGKQSALNSLVEQRRKTMSKLRGLVIPERSSEPAVANEPILDLPEIKSRDLMINTTSSTERERRTSVGSYPVYNPAPAPATAILSPPWSAQTTSPAIPKYSPAFKRKNISVYGSPNNFNSRLTSSLSHTPNKPPRSNGFSLDHYKSPFADSTTDIYNHKTSLTRSNAIDLYGRKNVLSDRSRSEEDSDNDSAVSSSRSSISPPSSPLLGAHHGLSQLDVEKTPLARTLSSETTASGTSNASTLTSGSDSDSQNRRILKAQSVEAINRKNVLTSAKYSRGFDMKNGAPLIDRKMIETTFADKIRLDQVDGQDSYPRKSSNENGKKEVVCYKLADEFTTCKRMPDVKIAFVNHVEYEELGELNKKKIEKTESSPVIQTCLADDPPAPVPRRVSVPLCHNGVWGNTHEPLFSKLSSQSIRSHSSSVDTIVEKPIGNGSVRSVESEGNFLDDGVDSSTEETEPLTTTSSPPVSTTAWSRVPDSTETSRPVIHKRVSSGSLLDNLGESTDIEQRNRSLSERLNARNKRSVSVNDIRKAFEKTDVSAAAKMGIPNHARVSSLDSTTSDDSMAPYDGTGMHREQFGSITSLASSTSLISPQELQSLIDEANLTLEESTGTPGAAPAGSHDVLVVILHRDSVGGSVGITLAGGADYEAKEITVHKVLAGSPADRDGRIQKGDRILSINGKSMKGATHRESLAILKSPRPEVVLVVSRLKAEGAESLCTDDQLTSSLRASLNGGSTRPPRILEGALLNEAAEMAEDSKARGPATAVVLIKDGAGLGFSLEGGKDSPLGDKPLVVKKIFTGGAAEKSGLMKAGDELLNVNGVEVSQMSRIEAWKLMKRIPDGNVAITIRPLL